MGFSSLVVGLFSRDNRNLTMFYAFKIRFFITAIMHRSMYAGQPWGAKPWIQSYSAFEVN